MCHCQFDPLLSFTVDYSLAKPKGIYLHIDKMTICLAKPQGLCLNECLSAHVNAQSSTRRCAYQ